LEGWGDDGGKVIKLPSAHEFLACLKQLAELVEAKVTNSRTCVCVADPLRLHEHHNVDNSEADGEDTPHNPDSQVIPRIVNIMLLLVLTELIAFHVFQ